MGKVKIDQSEIFDVLKSMPWPVPIDEIARQIGVDMADLRKELMRLERFGLLKYRKSPDDRVYTEWWTLDREEKFGLHLSIEGICGEWAY